MGHDVGGVDIDNVSLVAGHVGTENLTGSLETVPTDQAADPVDGKGWRRDSFISGTRDYVGRGGGERV